MLCKSLYAKFQAFLLICCASMAFATDYSPLTDWVDFPGGPAVWSFGGRVETGFGTGVFGDFIPADHIPDTWTSAPAGDGYVVPDTYGTCSVLKIDPWRDNPGPVMNAWVNHQATARVTPEPGIYNLSVNFIGTGYANPSIQITKVYVIKNGSDILWSGDILNYSTPAETTITNLSIAAGDSLDFISANNGTSESRSCLTANLTLVTGLNESECTVLLPADLNHDCVVDLSDFSKFAEQWLGCTRANDPDCQADIERVLTEYWIAQAFTGSNPIPPISFTYNGVSSTTFLPTWIFSRTRAELDSNRTQWTLVYTEPGNGSLQVTCQAIEYHDYQAVEWVVWFENHGSTDTPILENIQALDATFGSNSSGDFTLYYNGGTNNSIDDYQPLQTTLGVHANQSFVPYGGRPSDLVLPFFNLAQPDGSGIVLGVGWTGRWAAVFARHSDMTVNVQAGMDITHLKLFPGEKIRTPAILALTWSGGDRMRGHNQWRRLLLTHYTPTSNGQTVQPPIAASAGFIPFESTTETNMIQAIHSISANGLQIDTYWIDAGWYACPNGWASTVGDWTADPARYPNGLKPVSDAAHARGYKLLLWFEPERVMEGTPLYVNHPDWLLAPANLPPERQYQAPWRMLYYGNPAALAWAKTYFSAFIKTNGIDIYRQDLNLHPLWYWRNGEASDRQGMREIKHVMGLYEYLDFLISDNPGLLLDVCAGTGSRVDFEIMRRALNLTRSDGAWWNPIGEQSMTYGYSFWTAITGIGSISNDYYDFRSGMGGHIAVAFDYNNTGVSAWNQWKLNFAQYKPIKDLYTGDFYPLTGYNLADTVWMAWQYHSPELGQGLVQAFRRPGSTATATAMTFKLRGLDPSATFTVTNLDGGASTNTGDTLMKIGLPVTISHAPGSALIRYTKN